MRLEDGLSVDGDICAEAKGVVVVEEFVRDSKVAVAQAVAVAVAVAGTTAAATDDDFDKDTESCAPVVIHAGKLEMPPRPAPALIAPPKDNPPLSGFG